MNLHTYSKNFWMLCLSMFLFLASFNLILPELNEFITQLGGADKKGLIFVFFATSALISRPFSGKLSDTIGRKKVMYMGVFVSILVCLIYPLSNSVTFFLGLRLIHGLGSGFTPTGATALITDILPANRRGRGMGIWGTFISLGIGTGQSLGSPIFNALGLNALFIAASLTAVVSGILLTYVRETLPEESTQPFKWSLLKLGWKEIAEPSVWPAALVMFLSAVTSGIIFTVTPDISNYLNIDNKGWFFMFYTISTIGVRLFSGGLSDSIGRRKTLLMGMTLLITSIILISTAKTVGWYTASAIVFGFATGISSPTLFSWTADLSHPQRRGIGSGTMFIALECGFAVGGLSTMFTYDSTWASIPLTFSFAGLLAFAAVVYLIWHLKNRVSLY